LVPGLKVPIIASIFQSSDEENEDIKKDKPRPRVHSSSSRKQANLQETEIDGEPENTNSDRQRKISQCNSGNESDIPKKNYRKVTRLSSEQIVSLGRNILLGFQEIRFNVRFCAVAFDQ